MKSHTNSNPTIIAVILISVLLISTFMMFLFIIEFCNNYSIIKNQNEFSKTKVKIDSSEVSYSRSGKSSSSSYTTYYYFNKGHYISTQDTKGILFKYKDISSDIEEYMATHRDTINIWYLNSKTAKYAYENQKKIDTSEETENNKRVIIFSLIYIIYLLLLIKYKSKISWSN